MPGFAAAKSSTVTAFWRKDPKKAEETVRLYPQFQLRAYDAPEALCAADDVDAIFVASPDALHLEHVLLAVKHRKPVLCEKPMAMNSSECERMIEAADRVGVPLGIAQNFRFERSVNRIREIVAAGIIGKALLARSEFHYLGSTSPRTWINDSTLACGGPVGDVAVHCVDALRYILQDEVASVYARASHDAASGSVECAACLLLEFHLGTIADVIVSTRAEYRTPLWITGDKGMVGAEDALTVDHPVELHVKTHGSDLITETISNDHTYARQVDEFALSIERETAFSIPGSEGLRNQQILDAAYRSIKNGKREEIKGF